ncbi:beta-phosphoglucomutase family hydrolase [bacterium]|nr:beta-phosphoglucomutase family hydrolase [bacterium]
MSKLKAVLFDLDGVLVDSHYLHYKSWDMLAKDLSLNFTQKQGDDFRGMAREVCLERLLTVFNDRPMPSKEEVKELTDRKNRYYLDLLHNCDPDELRLPGAVKLLEDLNKAGIRSVVASGSKNAKDVIRCAKLGEYFYAVVDRMDITKTKPAPDIFLKAQEVSGAAPDEVVGIEDALLGLEALKAAGFKCVGVGAYVKGSDADLIRDSVADLTVADLRTLIEG